MWAVALPAYEKLVLSEGMSRTEVRRIIGYPDKVIQWPAGERGHAEGEEWHYFRKISSIRAEVRKVFFGYGFFPKSPDLKLELIAYTDANDEWQLVYEPEILRPVTSLKERLITPDITLSSVSLGLKGQGHRDQAGFMLEFSYVNNGKAPLSSVKFMAELVDDPDAAVSNEKAARIEADTSLPDVSYKRKGAIWLAMSRPGQISVPKYLRIKAFSPEGTTMTVGNSLYEISP